MELSNRWRASPGWNCRQFVELEMIAQTSTARELLQLCAMPWKRPASSSSTKTAEAQAFGYESRARSIKTKLSRFLYSASDWFRLNYLQHLSKLPVAPSHEFSHQKLFLHFRRFGDGNDEHVDGQLSEPFFDLFWKFIFWRSRKGIFCTKLF